MDEEDELDLGLSPVKKQTPLKGRRASNKTENKSPKKSLADDDLGLGDLNLDDDILSSPLKQPKAPRRSHRAGGWAQNSANSQSNERSEKVKKQDFSNDYEKLDAEIPVIPDLDDVQNEEFTTQIAVAPKVSVNHVSTYNELDVDLLKHAAFTSVDDVDLRLLTKCLTPEADIQEEDVPRSWEMLFTEISSALAPEPDEEDTEAEDG
ncbi:Intraflagellar transport protein 43 [Nymphon striatum]|nr:Intraflagellar transport protein 43 [Nymphon striatum]